MRQFFWAPKTYVQTNGLEIIQSFTLKTYDNSLDQLIVEWNFIFGIVLKDISQLGYDILTSENSQAISPFCEGFIREVSQK